MIARLTAALTFSFHIVKTPYVPLYEGGGKRIVVQCVLILSMGKMSPGGVGE